MDDAARMSRVQPVGDLDGPVEQGFEQQGLVANAMLQRGALQEFHRQERMPVVLADLVEGTDVRMIDGCRGARFPLEAFDRYAVASHFLREKFQGYFPAEFQVLGAIDDAHATAAKFLDNPVVRDVLAGCHRSPRSTLPQIVSLCCNIYDGWGSAPYRQHLRNCPETGRWEAADRVPDGLSGIRKLGPLPFFIEAPAARSHARDPVCAVVRPPTSAGSATTRSRAWRTESAHRPRSSLPRDARAAPATPTQGSARVPGAGRWWPRRPAHDGWRASRTGKPVRSEIRRDRRALRD